MWLDLKGAVVADTVYDSGVLTAKDTSFTLPAISQMTADLNAMGTMTVPIVGLLENMELSITKIGEDKGLGKMSKLDKHSFEFRWVQNVVKADGSTSPEGCKAFVRTFPPTALPGIGAEIGSASENELTYTANRVQIFVGGYEYLLVDRLSQILRIDGNRHRRGYKAPLPPDCGQWIGIDRLRLGKCLRHCGSLYYCRLWLYYGGQNSQGKELSHKVRNRPDDPELGEVQKIHCTENRRRSRPLERDHKLGENLRS